MDGQAKVEDRIVELDYDLQQAIGLADGIEEGRVWYPVLELTGDNAESTWHWILITKDLKFGYLSGSCDYTGWGCQAGADWHEAASLPEVLALCPFDVKRVFEDMISKHEDRRPNTGGL